MLVFIREEQYAMLAYILNTFNPHCPPMPRVHSVCKSAAMLKKHLYLPPPLLLTPSSLLLWAWAWEATAAKVLV